MEKDFQIGPWLVRPSLNTISRNRNNVHIEPKVMQVLVCLVQHAGEPVSKEELMRTVWSDTFVTDDVLTRSVSELRRVFEDDAKDSHVIQTIPKRGYRLLAAILPVNGAPVSAVQAAPIAVSGRAVDFASRRKLWIGALAFLGIAVVLFGLVAGFNIGGLRDRLWGTSAPPKIHSLAVLPLANLSGDPSQEYFADGMTDALITDLAQIGSLKVISRTSTMRYKKTDKPLPEIARELNVDGIVKGTVQRSGDRVRITAQLIYGPADKHLWANSYERDLRDVLALERDMARGIAKEIEVKLTPQEQARLTHARPVNLKSLEAYLQGKYHLDEAGKVEYVSGKEDAEQAELDLARSFFQQAIDAAPNYAASYVGLSKTWFETPVTEGGPEKTRAALEKALELDPDLAEAHLRLANLEHLREWNWSAAEREYKRAIELNPNSGDAHASYRDFLDTMGRFEEGMREFSRVQELDPGHYPPTPNPFFERRQYDKAIEMDLNDIQRHAFGFYPHWDLAQNYEAMGMHDEAVREWERSTRMLGYEDVANAMHRAFETSGYRGAYREWARGLQEFAARDKRLDAWVPAMVYAFLGEKDRAFFWLEKAYQNREAALPGMKVDPFWDNLRSDPRFKDLLRRVGLPQ